MRCFPALAILVALIITLSPLPAAAAGPACSGFFNQSEQGFKLEGGRLEPSGPTVAAGTEFEFNGITQIRDKFYLTRSRSDLMYDAENVELTSGCDLLTVAPKNVR